MSDISWLDPEELRVFRAFARSTRSLAVRFDQDLQNAVGMPRTYFEILWLLHQAPGHSLRMSDLAVSTLSQPSRISHAVGRLEKAGQVRRELCTSDRRGWFAVLTGEGLAALQKGAPRYAQSIREHLLEPLSRTQRDALAQIGETVLRELEHSSEPVLMGEMMPVGASARSSVTDGSNR
jgi:DNA-binding MarR family transcriptional regulator